MFVTFTFGAGLPILFPIALCSLTLLYVCERLQIFYWYREPPMYSSETNIQCLKAMKFAPIIYCINAAWLFSN